MTRVQRLLHRLAPRAPLVLVGLTVVSFVAAVVAARYQGLAGPWLWNFDMPKIDYPLASFYHDALRAGRLPLWNDQLGLGYPLYAEGQIGPFYPPNWVLFQFPPMLALDMSRILHLTIAGAGAGWLVLTMSGSRTGAFVAALVAVLGGAITAKLEWHNLVAAYAYAPWVLVPLVRRPHPTGRGLAAAGILFGIQALTGHPNTWLLTGVAAVLVMLATNPRPMTLVRIVAFGLLGVGVGGVQLVPTVVLTTLSVRSTGLSTADLFSSTSTPFDILGLAFQGAFLKVDGGAWNPYRTWYPDGAFPLYESAWYVGFPVLGLAAVGIPVQRARPVAIAALALIAIPVIAAFRPEPWAAIPILNGLRSPTRAYLMVALLLGVLAGIGVGRLGRTKRSLPRALLAVAAPLIAYGVVLAVVKSAPAAFDQLLLESSSFSRSGNAESRVALADAALTAVWPLVVDLGAAAAIVTVLALVARYPRGRALLAPLALVTAAVPLLWLGPLPNLLRPIDSFSYAGTEFVQAVASAYPRRVLTLSPSGFYHGSPDQLAAAHINDLRMFSSLDLAAVASITDDAGKDAAVALRRALGVDVVVTFGRSCPGRQVAASAPEKASICKVDASTAPYWIPESAVTVGPAEANPIWPQDAQIDLGAVGNAVPPVTVSRDDAGLTATIDAPEAGWVWIDRAWWPAWYTTVDGAGVPVGRVLGGQLIHVDAGRHVIRQWLLPWEALIGLVLGVAALAMTGIALRGSRAIRLAGDPTLWVRRPQ
jgi:hypothetical protein